jgi:hypothetical protein
VDSTVHVFADMNLKGAASLMILIVKFVGLDILLLGFWIYQR